jgi:hypothetical protein
MKPARPFAFALSALLGLPASAWAHDYPTVQRVEYVLECMRANGGKQEYLYKCSCAIDRIAQQLSYDDYVELSTALRNQTLSGPRGAEFRDPDSVKDMAKKYQSIQQAASKACFVP